MRGQAIARMPITAEDVEYVFAFYQENSYYPARIGFYRPNGQRVAEKDIVELAKKSREEKVTERYGSGGRKF